MIWVQNQNGIKNSPYPIFLIQASSYSALWKNLDDFSKFQSSVIVDKVKCVQQRKIQNLSRMVTRMDLKLFKICSVSALLQSGVWQKLWWLQISVLYGILYGFSNEIILWPRKIFFLFSSISLFLNHKIIFKFLRHWKQLMHFFNYLLIFSLKGSDFYLVYFVYYQNDICTWRNYLFSKIIIK